MEQFKKEVKKKLMSKFKFGPLTAENLMSANSDLFDVHEDDIKNGNQDADSIAEEFNARYENDEDEDEDEEE